MSLEIDNSSFIKELMTKKQDDLKGATKFFALFKKRKELINETKEFFLDNYSVRGILSSLGAVVGILFFVIEFFVLLYSALTQNFNPMLYVLLGSLVIYGVSLGISFHSRPKFLNLKNKIKQIEEDIQNMDDVTKIEILKTLLKDVKSEKVKEKFEKIMDLLSTEKLSSSFYDEIDNFAICVDEQEIKQKEIEKGNHFKIQLGLVQEDEVIENMKSLMPNMEKYQALL